MKEEQAETYHAVPLLYSITIHVDMNANECVWERKYNEYYIYWVEHVFTISRYSSLSTWDGMNDYTVYEWIEIARFTIDYADSPSHSMRLATSTGDLNS